MKLPELLCPAGDETALRAAVDNGADAVYLGYSRFGARATAANFDAEGLKRAVEYAHLYHARVHVTVNTLVKQQELEGVCEALETIALSGADAVIVQDLGVAELVRRQFPMLALHASTQMALSNATDARFAIGNGFRRVVLARECSLDDIRRVAETGIETEVFAHGALCTAVSGRCLMSSMAGGRSGNRGRCAQPCRQLFTLGDMRGALLSLKDLCLIDDLPALCEAGVASLKLEGRLKSAEYVAVVASVYRRALDDIKAGRAGEHSAQARDELRQIFNRGGFTRGHATGAQDAALCSVKRVSHEGVRLGTVASIKNSFANVALELALNDGDSLQLRGRQDMELRYSGPDMQAGQTARVRLRPGEAADTGSDVFRLSDAKQLARARTHAPKPIFTTMKAVFEPDEPMRLTLSDSESSVTVTGDIVQRAISRESTPQDARKQLGKLGGTPFALACDSDLTITLSPSLFLPVGALNALRRDAVDKLISARVNAFASSGRDVGATTPPCAASVQYSSHINSDTLAVIYHDPELTRPLQAVGATFCIWEPLEFRPKQFEDRLSLLADGTWLQLPQQLSESALQSIAQAVRRHASKLGGVVLGSIGQLALDLKLPTLAGQGVPVTNREAVRALMHTPISGFMLWPEWTKTELADMLPCELPALMKVYGREQLMLLNHCPARTMRDMDTGREQCALCTEQDMACGLRNAELRDRLGYQCPLQRMRTPEGCVLRVLGALPTLINDDAARAKLGAGALLHFTTETMDEQLTITKAFAVIQNGKQTESATAFLTSIRSTFGHWRRGVD